MQVVNRFLDKLVARIVATVYHTNVYGVARALLAFSTLSTLLFNDIHRLFPSGGAYNRGFFGNLKITKISIFHVLGNLPLEFSQSLCIIGLLLVIIGIYPRVTGILHWWITFSFFSSCPFVDGGDQVSVILSFLLIPICLTDKRRWHWMHNVPESDVEKIVAFFCLQAIRLQVAVIYFHAAVAKLNVEEWLNGTVIYYWFNHNTFGMPSWISPIVQPLITNPIWVVLITWGVLILEVALSMCLVIDKRYRQVFLVTGVAFHLGILLIHGLVSFFCAMSSALVLYLRPFEKGLELRQFWLELSIRASVARPKVKYDAKINLNNSGNE